MEVLNHFHHSKEKTDFPNSGHANNYIVKSLWWNTRFSYKVREEIFQNRKQYQKMQERWNTRFSYKVREEIFQNRKQYQKMQEPTVLNEI